MDKPYFIFDEWGMPLITGDPNSWKDSIGRLLEMEYAKNGLTRTVKALDDCLYYSEGRYRLKRHPGYEEHSSRDHWSYFLMYLYNRTTSEGIPMKVSFMCITSNIPSMRGMNLWIKTLRGNKRAEWWFYTIFNLGAYIHNFMDWAIVGIGNLGPECDNYYWLVFGSDYQRTKTRWQSLWSKIWGKVVPFYPVQNRAWQLKFLPESKRKERQKRIYLKRTDHGNYIVRALFGDTDISQEEADNYPEMGGDRSGVRLNLSCDRYIHQIKNTQNCYKRKLLQRLLSEI